MEQQINLETLCLLNQELAGPPNRLAFLDSADFAEHNARQTTDFIVLAKRGHAVSLAASVQAGKDVSGSDVFIGVSQDVQPQLEAMHLSPAFSAAVQRWRGMLDSAAIGSVALVASVATNDDLQFDLMAAGFPMVSPWTCGKRATLTGHRVYSEVSKHRIATGGDWVQSLSQFLGRMAAQRSGLSVGFGHMVEWCFPVQVLRRILNADVREPSGLLKPFLLEAVLDDFEFCKDKTAPSNLGHDESYQCVERLESLAKLLSPVFEILGCGDAMQPLSFAAIMKEAKAFIQSGKALRRAKAGSKASKAYSRLLTREPFGLLPWIDQAIAAAVREISGRFTCRDPSILSPSRFVPASDKQCISMLQRTQGALKNAVEEFLLTGTLLHSPTRFVPLLLPLAIPVIMLLAMPIIVAIGYASHSSFSVQCSVLAMPVIVATGYASHCRSLCGACVCMQSLFGWPSLLLPLLAPLVVGNASNP